MDVLPAPGVEYPKKVSSELDAKSPEIDQRSKISKVNASKILTDTIKKSINSTKPTQAPKGKFVLKAPLKKLQKTVAAVKKPKPNVSAPLVEETKASAVLKTKIVTPIVKTKVATPIAKQTIPFNYVNTQFASNFNGESSFYTSS